jgi:iron complex transport system substrate-binding protein
MYNLAISQMLRSPTSFFCLFIFFLLLGCKDQQRLELSNKNNLCKYSKYLHIYHSSKGFKIEISNPDQQGKVQAFIITKPFDRIAVLSATHVGMLSAIHQQQKICAVSDSKYLYNPILKKHLDQNRVTDLRSELGFSSEKLLRSKAQVIIYSGFGNESQQLKRLEEANILSIANYEWLLFGILSGQFEKAGQFFKRVEGNYLRLQTQVLQNNHSNQLPVLISGNLYGDQWIAPAGQSFEARIYKDAGFAYLFSKAQGSGSVFKSLPEILQKGTAVGLWLNPGQPTRSGLLKQYPKAKFFPFFNKRIFCYTANTNKYWEQVAVRPDWLLEDLSQIALKPTKKMHFYALVK